jgi:hypothetical protein
MKILMAATLTVGVALSSCAPTTPQARITRSPEMFAALDRKQQELVQQGQLARNMSPDAVRLAWGPPERTFEGFKGGKPTSRWDYADTQAVYSTHLYGGYGAYGRYGRIYGGGFGLGPDIAYIPYRVASVWFVDGRVDSWERVR